MKFGVRDRNEGDFPEDAALHTLARADAAPRREYVPAATIVREKPPELYTSSPQEMSFFALQQNLELCMGMVESEVMKGYFTSLSQLPVVKPDPQYIKMLDDAERILFFRITQLVYQENEFSVQKLATVFHALSNKPCTLVLLIKSDGQNNEVYLGVRSRDEKYSTSTMKHSLKTSLEGLFPGSQTEDLLIGDCVQMLDDMKSSCVSSVSCVADYKQNGEALSNKNFIQGLEKFIFSMQGTAYSAIFIANNLSPMDIQETRQEYEQIYTQLSPFSNMQYNFSLNRGRSSSNSDTTGTTDTVSKSESRTVGENESTTDSTGTSKTLTKSNTDTDGSSVTKTEGVTTSTAVADGTTHTEGDTHTEGHTTTATLGANIGGTFGGSVSKGANVAVGIGKFLSAGISGGVASFASKTIGLSGSVSRSKSTSDAHSVSDSVSRTLTQSTANNTSNAIGSSHSRSIGISDSQGISETSAITRGKSTQLGESEGTSRASSVSQTLSLTDSFGDSQAITLNVQNKSLTNILQRLDRQMERLSECESVGMWDFAAYFLGESAAEAETAANMYQSLISGSQSGVQKPAVNTWIENADDISIYVKHFLHPVFLYTDTQYAVDRQVLVDPSSLSSTTELAIQMGLPRFSVTGLPVIEHVPFAQEVLRPQRGSRAIHLGKIDNLGKETSIDTDLDLESLSMHTFVTGSTGSGKSNTVYGILDELTHQGVKFLVVEPAKGEYKDVFGNIAVVYGTNPMYTRMLHINPFRFPKGIHILEHVDRLVEIFNVCWPMYAAMPAVLKDAILQAYEACGWDLERSINRVSPAIFPSFSDLQSQIVQVIRTSGYSDDTKSDYIGSLATRVKSLCNGLNGQIFSNAEVDDCSLFDRNTIVDLSRIGSQETKSLIMGILIMRLSEYRASSSKGRDLPLSHVTVLEEAHNILKRTSTEQSQESSNIAGKSVELLSNAIAEMRTYGEGFIIADQSPSTVDMSAIRNTNTKIIMRLPDESDRCLVGRAAALKDEQLEEIARLPRGVAVVYQNDWIEPVLCRVRKYEHSEDNYHYSPIPKSSSQGDAWVKTELLKIILGERIAERIEIEKIDVPEVRRALVDSSLAGAQKAQLYSVLKEFERTHKVSLWEDGRFAALSSEVVDILGCRDKAFGFIRNAGAITDLNRELMRIIDGQTTYFPHSSQPNIIQCIIKDYCEKNPSKQEFYDKWVQETRQHRKGR